MSRFYSWLNEAKYNKGDIAEVVLGAAITAKFLKVDNSLVRESEVISIIRQVINTLKIDTQRPDVSSGELVYDNIIFKVSVPKGAVEFLKKEDISEITDVFKSAIEYANKSEDINKQSEELRKNSKIDSILINSDGTGDQKGTKADIKLFINNKPTRNQISLKVTGGEQFAQVSGVGFKKQENLWKDGLGINITPLKNAYEQEMKNFDSGLRFLSRKEDIAQEQKQIVKNAMGLVYKFATEELNKLFQKREMKFMKNFIDFIASGIAGDEKQFIELVKLEKGKFKSIRTDSKKFKDMVNSLDLIAIINKSGDPKVIIKDKNSNKPLIQIRAKTELASSKTKEGKIYKIYPRNYIEAPSNSILFSL